MKSTTVRVLNPNTQETVEIPASEKARERARKRYREKQVEKTMLAIRQLLPVLLTMESERKKKDAA